MLIVDSHCHLDLLTLPENDSINDVVARAKKNHVGYLLNVCVSLEKFPQVLATALEYTEVSASVGLHPNAHEAFNADTLLKLAAHEKVVAIGETGLDYFRSTGDLNWQRDRFRDHINVAKRIKKPLIIHTRDAQDDTIALMQTEKANDAQGVMHCFSEDWTFAKKALDLGFYISFSGIVTFKNATAIQEVAKKMPLDRMLVETDSPYLAPNPMRGKQNEPANVYHTAQFIAGLRNIPLAELTAATTHNFFSLFQGAVKPYV